MSFPDLSEKRIVVAGAGGGIGAAIVKMALEAGASVLAVDVDQDRLDRTVEAARDESANRWLVARLVDVTNPNDLQGAIASGTEVIGIPNVVINTVGVTFSRPLLDTTVDDVLRLSAVNVASVLTVVQGVVPFMRSGGSIVNFASSAASTVTAGLGLYGATKAAVIFLTRALANELAPRSIRVNAVAPGIVDTPMPRLTMADEPDPEGALLRVVRETHLIPRLARPEEIASGALFLASDAASFATGATLFIDGGNSCQTIGSR